MKPKDVELQPLLEAYSTHEPHSAPIDATLGDKGIPIQTAAESPSTPASGRNGRLRFAADENAPERPKSRKLEKAEQRLKKTSGKLEQARENLPVKRKLRFEDEVKTQKEHLKGALPLRPVKAGLNTAIVYGHKKIFQVEDDNVEIKAVHKGEMLAEGGVRTALRFKKTAPYRKAAKLEQKAVKQQIDLTYRQNLEKNPKLNSNMFSRAWQKRKIKKDYAKKTRETKKAAERAKEAVKKTGDGVVKVGKAIIKNPKVTILLLLLGFLLLLILSMCSAGSGLMGGGIGGLSVATYPSEDADIVGAQAAYAAMEADLKNRLDNYASLNPGYDEYHFNLDRIWHNPYSLISIISAFHEGAWTLDEVQGTLAMLFERQYTLTETVVVEVRSYEVSYTDDEGNSYSETVYYNYYIVYVTLDNFNLSHLPIYMMSEMQLSMYALFMSTLGNRPDLIPVASFPDASYYQDYGRHDIPPEYFVDETFAAIIKEAEKYLGYPYVWGGYNPNTSFDCSGFVSWVYNQSGWNFGRLGAQGLYNISSPVSASNAKPGDLIFFVGTYDTPGVSHVGIYVGDGMMLHCGNHIGYSSINTAYWQSKLFAYGRMYD